MPTANGESCKQTSILPCCDTLRSTPIHHTISLYLNYFFSGLIVPSMLQYVTYYVLKWLNFINIMLILHKSSLMFSYSVCLRTFADGVEEHLTGCSELKSSKSRTILFYHTTSKPRVETFLNLCF